jgi:ABC-2 type transport system ATP-binding protein
MPEPALELQDLAKSYGSVRALDRLTARVAGGPVGLLGPNGAGKTTLIKLLLGLLRPDAGQARVFGLDPSDARGRLAVRRAVGYMPESDCLIPGMTAVELVTTMGRLAGMSYRDALTRAHEVLDYVGLEEARYRGLDEYSTGMKQRLKLAQSLVHDPALLLLDEPTNGLDPKGRREMLALVHDLGHTQGKSLLVCSHLLPDVERTCDEVLVLHKGRVLAAGPIDELTRSRETWTLVEVASGAEAFARELRQAGLEAEPAGSALRVSLPGGNGAADRLFALAEAAGASVTRLVEERPTLEDVFLDALDGAERHSNRPERRL